MNQPATSNYKQVRLQVSETEGGRISIFVFAKPLGARWDYNQIVYRHEVRRGRDTSHWLDLLAVAFYQVAGEALPDSE